MRHLAFIQCVGSRDLEHTYCSRVCCAYGLRLARLIRHRWPECQVTTFYMDLQNVGPDPKEFEATVRQEIELIRALPGDLSATADGSLRLKFLDEASGQGLYRVVDLLVLAVGIAPGPDNPKLAEMLHLKLDPDGFLKDGQEGAPDRSPRRVPGRDRRRSPKYPGVHRPGHPVSPAGAPIPGGQNRKSSDLTSCSLK